MRLAILLAITLATVLAPPAEASPQKRVRELIEQLENGSVSERIEAAKKLGKYRSRAAVAIDPLIHTLSANRDDVREAASSALRRIGDEARGRLLASLDGSADPPLVAPMPGAVRALLDFDREGENDVMTIVTSRELTDEWIDALSTFEEFGLRALLRSTVLEPNRDRVTRALMARPPVKPLPRDEIATLVPESVDEDTRLLIAILVGHVVRPEEVAVLADWSPRHDRAEWALHALRHLPADVDVELVEAIVARHLVSRDQAMRRRAQWGLVRLLQGDPEVDLSTYLAAKDPERRRHRGAKVSVEKVLTGNLAHTATDMVRRHVGERYSRDMFVDDPTFFMTLLGVVREMDQFFRESRPPDSVELTLARVVGVDNQKKTWELSSTWPDRVAPYVPVTRDAAPVSERAQKLADVAMLAAQESKGNTERLLTVKLVEATGDRSSPAIELYFNAALQPDRELREAGLHALVNLGGVDVDQWLRGFGRALDTPSVRDASSEVFLRVGTDDAKRAVLDALEYYPEWPALPMVWATLDRDEALKERLVEIAIRRTANDDPVAAAFAARGGDEGVEALESLLESELADHRVVAAVNLVRLKAKGSLAAAKRVLQADAGEDFLAPEIAALEKKRGRRRRR